MLTHSPIKIKPVNFMRSAPEPVGMVAAVSIDDDDPLLRVGLGIFAYRCRNGGEALDIVYHQAVELDRAAKQVDMAFDDAGHHRIHLGVNNTGVTALQGFHVRVGAHGQNAVAGDGQRFGPHRGLFHGENTGIGDDQIGRWHDFSLFCAAQNAGLQSVPQASTFGRSSTIERR